MLIMNIFEYLILLINIFDFPTLLKMLRDVFSTTATSTQVENFFSYAGLVITNRKNSLADNSICA